MKYITQTNIIIAVIVLVIIGLLVFSSVSSKKQMLSNDVPSEVQETATTTPAEANSEEVVNEEPETSVEPTSQSPLRVKVETTPITKKELGPRQPATVSPRAALDYFAEALQAGDVERAVSYFSESVRDGYRTTFTDYVEQGRQHPVVTAYLTGTVGDVELIQPEYGIYEIRVSPKGATDAYTLNFFFENNEFVIWEL